MNNLFAMFGLGTYDLLIVGLVAVLLFGSSLPSTMKSLGLSYGEFHKGLREGQKETEKLEQQP